ncbi:hypothetical protein MUK42_22329 [Musa troglodytarum]|uniref:Uncharacterized protein n=1 Tax=Musa troglodytarum TaxID=320322 RepID=A0A9E7KCR6_9LILI|nr:hypothetical protein MUK42_22329 [Musa troglodytarum]
MELRSYDISLSIPLGFPFVDTHDLVRTATWPGALFENKQAEGRGSCGVVLRAPGLRPRRGRSSSLAPPWSALRWRAMGGSRRKGFGFANGAN